MFSDYNFADLASIFVMQGFSGLSLFAVFVLMSLGLAIIFGQMGVINMAHGEFMILGAYVTWLTGKFSALICLQSSASTSLLPLPLLSCVPPCWVRSLRKS
jgi:branched-subunit amino acid ABC-type transport system permease component